MVSKKVVAKTDAVRVKRQHTTPCSDCPFRRDSIPGWLGGYTVEQYVQIATYAEGVDCHTRRKPDDMGGDFHQCAGMAIYHANVLKSPRDPQAFRLPPNKSLAFAWPTEFTAHHSKVLV